MCFSKSFVYKANAPLLFIYYRRIFFSHSHLLEQKDPLL